MSIPAFVLFELPPGPEVAWSMSQDSRETAIFITMKMAVPYVQQQEREVQRVVVSLHLKLSDKLPINSKCLSQLVVAFVCF